MKRRAFLTNASMGLAALAGGALPTLAAESSKNGEAGSKAASRKAATTGPMGRPVRIVSVGFLGGPDISLDQIISHVDQEGSRGADIIVLPELCRGQDKTSEESLDGPTVKAMAALASKHRTYMSVPIDRWDGNKRYNTTVLLDRSGHVVAHYDKLFPYWSEYDPHPPVSPGDSGVVYETDFGRLGLATCFDANFPEVWAGLAEKGAELVTWSSAYSGASSLQAHALNHHYYIVTCTATPDCIAYDITGERLLYESHKGINVSRVTLDLDRGIYHENFNLEKRDKLLREHPQDVALEQWLRLEQWFVLKPKRPGVNARALAKQYGLEELRPYIDRSRVAIDQRRGWEFAGKVAFPEKSIDEIQAFSKNERA